MKKYEVMYILRATLDDAQRNELIGKLNDILTVNGGSVDSVNEWGVKDLAYEIDDEKKGYYVLVEATVSSSEALSEFDRVCKINSNVLRQLVIAK